MISMFRLLGQYWYVLAVLAGAALLLGLYLSAYFSALRPRPGTLEWIAGYDRPALAMAGQWQPLRPKDAAFLAPACAAALAVWSTVAVYTYRAAGEMPPGAILYAAILYGLAPVCTAASAYCLIRCLFGCAPAALLGALVLTLDLTADPVAQLAAAWMVLLLARYFTAPVGRSFASDCAPLALCAAMLAAACYLQPALWPLAGGGLLLLLLGCAARFVEQGQGRLWRSLALFLPVFAAVYYLLHLPAALIAGMGPQALFSADYARLVAARLMAGFRGLFGFRAGWALAVLSYDWPLLLLGLGATAAALVSLRRRDFRAGLLGALFLILTLLWLFCGPYALPLAAVLSLGYLWSELYRRRAYVLFSLAPALLLALLGTMFIAIWLV